MAFGNGAMQKPAVTLQPARAFDAARPGEIGKAFGHRQGARGNGGGQHQRLNRPGDEGEDAGQC
jgi:hypothetical protein